MIEPPLNTQGRERFGVFAQRIFACAVEAILTQRKYDDAPAVVLRDEAHGFLETMEKAQKAIDGLDEGLRSLLDRELASMAHAGQTRRTLPTTSIELWRKTTSDLIAHIIVASRKLEIAPVKGESRTVYRQMVRGLLALVFDLTGDAPRRSTVRRHAGDSAKEDYWFLRFAQRMADLVATSAASLETTLGQDAVQSSGNRPHPRKRVSRRPRKIVGAPPLSSVVREELQAFHLELSGGQARRSAGETNRSAGR